MERLTKLLLLNSMYRGIRYLLGSKIKTRFKAYEEGNSPKTQKLRISDHDQLDRALYKWFVGERGQGIPVSGPIVKTKAAKYAEELGIHDFKGSDG